MNRGTYSNNITYNARYRLLILNDPTDPVNCTVAFGSHNLGYKASYANDENLVIVRGHQLLALELTLLQTEFCHESPQFLKGKRKAARSALHSSSVFAVVVMLMFRPRRASILSYSISGKMICSLTPTL